MNHKEGGGRRGGEELSPMARQLRQLEPYLSAVWKLVGATGFGVLAGYFLDRWLKTAPWMLLGLSAVGIAVGFYGFVKDMMRLGSS